MSLKDKWKTFVYGDNNQGEVEFLPSILEITDKPPSPVGRMVLWTILILLVCLGIWSVVGHVTETAVAEGKVIPTGQVKTIQVKNKGIVKEIKVKEGDFVHEGDVLVVLDPTSTDADYYSLKKRAEYYKLDIQRLEAEQTGKPFLPKGSEGLESSDILAEEMLFRSRQGQYNAEKEAAQATLEQKKAALNAAYSNYEKYRDLLSIATDKENRLESLVSQNAISEFQLLEQRSQRIDIQKNMSVELNAIEEAKAEIAEAEKKLRSVDENYSKDIMTSLVEAHKQYYALEEEIKKADENNRMATIVAPCDGRVYNLAIHTMGGIVTDAQALMMIVPDNAALELEVWADNKDIGFIKIDQDAELKVETFNFQKYGVVNAKVIDIGADAANDENDRLTYGKYRIRLSPEKIVDEKSNIFLSPGMHVTAEIKIKDKRIIDFFLDPFRQYTSEALRER